MTLMISLRDEKGSFTYGTYIPSGYGSYSASEATLSELHNQGALLVCKFFCWEITGLQSTVLVKIWNQKIRFSF